MYPLGSSRFLEARPRDRRRKPLCGEVAVVIASVGGGVGAALHKFGLTKATLSKLS